MRVRSGWLLLMAVLSTGASAQSVTDALRGKWSIDCEKGYLRIFEQNGRLMQQGMVTMTELPIPPDVLPPAPLDVRAKGDRVVLISRMQFGDIEVRGIARGILRGSSTLQVVDAMGCMDTDCESIKLNETLRRCD